MRTGIIENCVDDETIDLIATTLKSKQQPFINPHSMTWPSSVDTGFFKILERKIVPKLKKHFDPFKLVKLNYTETTKPFGVHFDDWQTHSMGTPYMSILLPISENGIKTFVFDNVAKYDDVFPRNTKIVAKEFFKNHPVGKSCFRPGMEHILEYGGNDILHKIKFLKELPWKKNSAIYWHSTLLHSGSNIDEKKFIIMHTIRDEGEPNEKLVQ